MLPSICSKRDDAPPTTLRAVVRLGGDGGDYSDDE